MADKSQTLTGEGNQYSTSNLSETVRHQVVNIRIADEVIQLLQQQLAIT